MKKLASILIAVAIVFGFVALPFMESNAAEVVKEDSFDEIVSVLHFADMFTSGHPDWSLEFTNFPHMAKSCVKFVAMVYLKLSFKLP